jgi:flagellar FliJ protein
MRFEAREKARKVSDLESMIREFEMMADDLDRQILTEEERTGVRDLKHFNYSTFAKAARQRRDNLQTSVDDLKAKLALAVEERDVAVDNLGKVENPEVGETPTRGRRVGERGSSALAS